jgi:hypothetical protein
MVKRIVLFFLGCAACATVADLEVNRVDGGGGSSSSGSGSSGNAAERGDSDEAGATPPAEAGVDAAASIDAGPTVHACGCDAGSSCCVRTSSAPACDVPSCTEPGSFVVGCVRSTNDGRDCCWSPDGGIATASFRAGCGSSLAACETDDDCAGHGDKCTTLACKGVALGVCASSAPTWFVCPP